MYDIDKRPTTGGFGGTIPNFMDWLTENLSYGGVIISDPQPSTHGFPSDRLVHRVELITAGYSDDEDLLGRVYQGSLFALMFWRELHAGGLYVYEVPVERFDSTQQLAWLDPKSNVFREIHRARTIIMHTVHGDEIELDLPHGATLSFSEPDRDINKPAGVLTIEPIVPD